MDAKVRRLASGVIAVPPGSDRKAVRHRRIAQLGNDIRYLRHGRGFLTGGYPVSMVRAALGWLKYREFPALAGVAIMGSGDHDPGSRSTDEAALSARLRRLGERLERTGAGRAKDTDPAPRSRADTSGLARGFRLSTEFVAGVLIGALVGWLIDRWLHISPWGLIVFLLLGFAAGVLNVMRAAGLAASPSGGTERREN
jgi:ATP synthase protein I